MCGMGFGDDVLPANFESRNGRKRSINGGRKKVCSPCVPFSRRENGMFPLSRFLVFLASFLVLHSMLE